MPWGREKNGLQHKKMVRNVKKWLEAKKNGPEGKKMT
jgi:hypothetical protein